ncbi:MAG: HAMP domain-containing histidine kinase [Saprospiraceae bacterium]|nr:HAMP domain-containing histidine kinase [Saprospiraceae bacterium]
MDLYNQKSRWKIYLAIAGTVIVLASLIYTSYLTQQLAIEERNKAEVLGLALRKVSEPLSEECESCRDYTFPQDIIIRNQTIPVMLLTDGRINPDGVVNFPKIDMDYLEKQLAKMEKDDIPPIVDTDLGTALHYRESTILTQLRWYPVIQLFLIAAFILFGYLTFSSARRAEQNRVWVGMAKETAHQLGTPISGIVAWIEHLRLLREQDAEMHDILNELGNDVNRLELIADRFSKIGSAPELQKTNIYLELEKCRAYMQRRAPRNVSFTFPEPDTTPAQHVLINPHLFEWVIENLLRNALDAMGRKGNIEATVREDGDFISIDVTDTGKGIPSARQKTVFNPGYTTKKRGWGLGLSLAKRIIEEYHSGLIFVKRSEEGVGTTFTIKLKKG